MKFIEKHIQLIVAVAVGLAAFALFRFVYPGHLHFAEQYQLFLFTSEYFTDLAQYPGGISDYIGRFVTQFFYITSVGAALMGILAALNIALIFSVARQFGMRTKWWLALAILPSAAMLSFLCDEYAMTSFPVAILISLGACRLLFFIENQRIRRIAALIAMPILYWIVGGAHIVFAIVAIASDSSFYNKKYTEAAIVAAVGILEYLLCPILASWIVALPLHSLFFGVDFFRDTTLHTNKFFAALILTSVIPIIISLLPRIKKIVGIGATIVVIAISFYWIKSSLRLGFEEFMQYDYLARNQQWQLIIQKAERKTPLHEMTIAYLNLALGMTNQLCDRMFEFFQIGSNGLINTWKRDCTTAFPLSEIYYHLGMLNSSLRYTNEALESIPDHQKSGRCLKRMAEINLINGHYTVARKYCYILKHSIFYRRDAEEMLRLLDYPELIDRNAEFAHLRKISFKTDFYFNNREFDLMAVQSLIDNGENRMIFEYCMAWELLNGDLEKMLKYTGFAGDMQYSAPPRALQEAFTIYNAEQMRITGQKVMEIPKNITQRFAEFAQMVRTPGMHKDLIFKKFGSTYWFYYYLSRK